MKGLGKISRQTDRQTNRQTVMSPFGVRFTTGKRRYLLTRELLLPVFILVESNRWKEKA